MKKIAIFLGLSVLSLAIQPALAAVNLLSGPTSLVTSPTSAPASSTPTGLFSFTLSQDGGETLSSVNVTLNKTASSTLSGADISSLTIYKDNGDGIFDPSTDLLAGTQTSVTIDGVTSIPLTINNTIATSSSKFFLAVKTNSSWSDTTPIDAFLASMPINAIITSTSSPTSTAATTSLISADTTGPALTGVVAHDTAGTDAKQPGDTIVFTFNEATNKPAITNANVNAVLVLNNSHSFLDTLGNIGSATWNPAGTVLTLTLSGTSTTTVASVNLGDTVTVVTPSNIKDSVGNGATGAVVITGTFGTAPTPDTTGPSLSSVVAYDTAGTDAKQPGDAIVFTFNEATNKPAITSANINTVLGLNNSHSFLDTLGNIGATTWNASGTQLTLTLSGVSIATVASVALGDSVTVATPSIITDAASNKATGSAVITGTFGTSPSGGTPPTPCSNGLKNGLLYMAFGDTNVYLAAACELKVFNGQAIWHAKGKKFKGIIQLNSLNGLTIPSISNHNKHEDEDGDHDDNDDDKKNSRGGSVSGKIKIKVQHHEDD